MVSNSNLQLKGLQHLLNRFIDKRNKLISEAEGVKHSLLASKVMCRSYPKRIETFEKNEIEREAQILMRKILRKSGGKKWKT